MTKSMDSLPSELPPVLEGEAGIFRKSLPLRLKLHEVLNAIGDVSGKTCGDVVAGNSMLSHYLRRSGGVWHTACPEGGKVKLLKELLKENVEQMEGDMLPFKDQSLDVLIVINVLERVDQDLHFVEECNRVLKQAGQLVVVSARLKPVSLLPAIHGMLGLSYMNRGLMRPGYTESDLFHILKDGFDVHHVRSYSRFFLEWTDAWTRFMERRCRLSEGDVDAKIKKLYATAGPLYRLSDQLDMLLFLTKGHSMIASAKRRGWRTRSAPVLTDGRTISEAVLKKPGV